MPRNDYAILVGISHYPAPGFPPLQGPPRDVQRFHDWLIDPQGGDVNPAHITTLLSPDPPPQVPPDQAPPQFSDFQVAFQQLITGGGGNIQYHSDNRLYLFFSGHGFCEIRNQMPQAAIYAANASRLFHWNISGTLYALWVKDVAIFGEIVLVMDCCRDAEATKMLMNPPLPAIVNPGSASNVKLFCVYAAPKGGKAQERPIPERNNEVHSLLTHALLEAFKYAAPDGNGNITGQMIKGYVEDIWPTMCGDIPADKPEIYIPPSGDIVFFRRPPARLPQKIRVTPWGDGDTIEIFDGHNQLFATLKLSEADHAMAGICWANRTTETVPVVASEVTLPLPAGLYRVKLQAGAEERQQLFQAGGPDVQL
ncbi:MAG: hypothetical protein V2B19_07425 [Pseudomonadota bacterium]